MILPQRNPVTPKLEESQLFRNLPVIVPGLVGAIFLILGLIVSWNHVNFLRHSTSAIARVTGVEAKRESTDSGYRTRYYPVLEFRDAFEVTHEFIGEVSRNNGDRSGWKAGSNVSIRYNTANPNEARMAGVFTLFPFVFLALGLGAIALAFKMRSWTKEIARREAKCAPGTGLRPKLP